LDMDPLVPQAIREAFEQWRGEDSFIPKDELVSLLQGIDPELTTQEIERVASATEESEQGKVHLMNFLGLVCTRGHSQWPRGSQDGAVEELYLRVPPALAGALAAHDFSNLVTEKCHAHMPGTREWAFAQWQAWLSQPDSSLFWISGQGGIGKSVLVAELLRRALEEGKARCIVAHHFCRHDDAARSEPPSMLQSLGCMLCANLPGYEEALKARRAEVSAALGGGKVDEMFAVLFARPLERLKPPTGAGNVAILIDALDELPKGTKEATIRLLAQHFRALPPWLKLTVTSRDEPSIKRALSRFLPTELRADEAHNQPDVRVY